VSGIVHSSELVSEIAKSSDAQSIGISQIGDAITQVSQVVQQNSATAEESAAASEEMSSQASLLQQLISQFKLKASVAGGGVFTPPAAPSPVRAPRSGTGRAIDSFGAGKYYSPPKLEILLSPGALPLGYTLRAGL
jgi:CII-binding regulator of phage lambda lysogenization HflD